MKSSAVAAAFKAGLRPIGKRICRQLCGFQDPLLEMRRLAEILRPGAILDIGAHVGTVSQAMESMIPHIPIHAFEPSPETAVRLRNAVRNSSRIVVHELAIGSRDDAQRLYVNRNEQTNSLLDNDETNNRFLSDATAHEGEAIVSVLTLDSWMKEHGAATPLFIKSDIQGGELDLIAGAQHTLRHNTAVLMSEASLMPMYQGGGDFFQIHAALTQDLPFRLLDIYRTYRNAAGQAMWTDAIWVHRDWLTQLGG